MTHKIIINAKDLLYMLTIAKKVFDRNMPVPILENFLFHVEGGYLVVSATDIATRVAIKKPIKHSTTFTALVPPDIMKYLKLVDTSVTLAWDDTKFSLEVTSDEDKAKYTADSPADYPKEREFTSTAFTYTTDLFSEFKNLYNYIGEDELRPAMCCVCLMIKSGQANLCATEGHRLFLQRVEKLDDPKVEESRVLMIHRKPAKIISDLQFSSQELKCYYNHDMTAYRFAFKYGAYEIEIDSHNMDEQFPRYWEVIPKDFTTKYTIDRQKFMKLLDKAELMANKTTHAVTLSLNGKNTISSQDLDFNCEYNAEIGGKHEGQPIEISFNSRLLKSTIESFEGDITIEMTKPNKATVIRSGSKLALLMPVQTKRYDEI